MSDAGPADARTEMIANVRDTDHYLMTARRWFYGLASAAAAEGHDLAQVEFGAITLLEAMLPVGRYNEVVTGEHERWKGLILDDVAAAYDGEPLDEGRPLYTLAHASALGCEFWKWCRDGRAAPADVIAIIRRGYDRPPRPGELEAP